MTKRLLKSGIWSVKYAVNIEFVYLALTKHPVLLSLQ